MRRVVVGHSREGYALHIQDAPWWTYTVKAVAGAWPCSHAWRLGPRVWDAWNWVMVTPDRHQTGHWTIPCDEATAHAMSEPGTWDYVDGEA